MTNQPLQPSDANDEEPTFAIDKFEIGLAKKKPVADVNFINDSVHQDDEGNTSADDY
ncbi:hypothetical protein EDF88_4456 [Buttiauxella sp. BIGb0552]|jgi:hypothetical protein|uniref:Uncharacterized protein n=1 Tax=Buttiauxella agrestis TaxID=82977 RepID=A0A381KN81_9ENTR|nr:MULTISPECIES: hypothetical protein [Buttiauxella]TDX11859.1 hypothetical protein EDF88_4456 [Buttiauxella sp. BIGb0552]SUY92824.1 Uncharacterised protein [Buttiauxella agrestis]